MVIPCMFLANRLNCRRLLILSAVGSIGKVWPCVQSHLLRSGSSSASWLRDQSGRGQFFEHINSLAQC